ncbi:hypothetical protein V8C86DRAFT_2571572 [Haematococcus lacustris]
MWPVPVPCISKASEVQGPHQGTGWTMAMFEPRCSVDLLESVTKETTAGALQSLGASLAPTMMTSDGALEQMYRHYIAPAPIAAKQLLLSALLDTYALGSKHVLPGLHLTEEATHGPRLLQLLNSDLSSCVPIPVGAEMALSACSDLAQSSCRVGAPTLAGEVQPMACEASGGDGRADGISFAACLPLLSPVTCLQQRTSLVYSPPFKLPTAFRPSLSDDVTFTPQPSLPCSSSSLPRAAICPEGQQPSNHQRCSSPDQGFPAHRPHPQASSVRPTSRGKLIRCLARRLSGTRRRLAPSRSVAQQHASMPSPMSPSGMVADVLATLQTVLPMLQAAQQTLALSYQAISSAQTSHGANSDQLVLPAAQLLADAVGCLARPDLHAAGRDQASSCSLAGGASSGGAVAKEVPGVCELVTPRAAVDIACSNIKASRPFTSLIPRLPATTAAPTATAAGKGVNSSQPESGSKQASEAVQPAAGCSLSASGPAGPGSRRGEAGHPDAVTPRYPPGLPCILHPVAAPGPLASHPLLPLQQPGILQLQQQQQQQHLVWGLHHLQLAGQPGSALAGLGAWQPPHGTSSSQGQQQQHQQVWPGLLAGEARGAGAGQAGGEHRDEAGQRSQREGGEQAAMVQAAAGDAGDSTTRPALPPLALHAVARQLVFPAAGEAASSYPACSSTAATASNVMESQHPADSTATDPSGPQSHPGTTPAAPVYGSAAASSLPGITAWPTSAAFAVIPQQWPPLDWSAAPALLPAWIQQTWGPLPAPLLGPAAPSQDGKQLLSRHLLGLSDAGPTWLPAPCAAQASGCSSSGGASLSHTLATSASCPLPCGSFRAAPTSHPFGADSTPYLPPGPCTQPVSQQLPAAQILAPPLPAASPSPGSLPSSASSSPRPLLPLPTWPATSPPAAELSLEQDGTPPNAPLLLGSEPPHLIRARARSWTAAARTLSPATSPVYHTPGYPAAANQEPHVGRLAPTPWAASRLVLPEEGGWPSDDPGHWGLRVRAVRLDSPHTSPGFHTAGYVHGAVGAAAEVGDSPLPARVRRLVLEVPAGEEEGEGEQEEIEASPVVLQGARLGRGRQLAGWGEGEEGEPGQIGVRRSLMAQLEAVRPNQPLLPAAPLPAGVPAPSTPMRSYHEPRSRDSLHNSSP